MNSKNVLNIKYDNLKNKYNDIDILPTFNKICLAQNLLKEMNSLKERFDENKNKILNEIEKNCFSYYRKKIESKNIYDYFDSNNLEKYFEYKLNTNVEKVINKDLFNIINNFLFIIRNNFPLLIKIIYKCDYFDLKDLCDFITHLFFEDTSTYSFIQDELLFFSFFIFKKFINEVIPNNLNDINNNINDITQSNILNNENFKNNFSFFFINSLTKKPDIRNYFSSFLSEIINKIKECKDNLSPNLKIILKDLGINEKKNIKKEKHMKAMTFVEQININHKGILKRKIKESNDNLKKKIKENENIKNKYKKEGIFYDFELIDVNTSAYPNSDQKLDSFFDNENTHMLYIGEKYNFYESNQKKTFVEFALAHYFEKILYEITGVGEPVEIFSNVLLRNDLKLTKINGDEENHQKIINKYKLNFDFITSFINILLLKIKENINSLPLTLKYIFKIIDELYKIKFSSENKNINNFNLLILKAKLFIEEMIIPVIKYELVANEITSNLAKDNLNTIFTVLKKAISGNLFFIDENGFTIFNKYIIEIMPQIFEIAYNLNKDSNLPEYIAKLITSKDDIKRYEYFKEKKEENIQFQSICFSFKEIYILLNIISNNKDYFIKQTKNEREKKLLQLLIKKKDVITLTYKNDLEKRNINYYLLTKVYYKPEFDNKIKAIIQDSFEIFFKDQKNDIVLKFKKCLSFILTHINYLQNEDFTSLINRKEEIIISNNEIEKNFFKYKKNLLYENTSFDKSLKIKKEKKIEVKTQDDLSLIKKGLRKINNNDGGFKNLEKNDRFFIQRKSVIKSSITFIKEELDFQTKILPKISSKILSEFFYKNSKKENFHRILFCNSFIQEHIKDLPNKYIQYNFKNIFNEIIQETIFMIKELQNNILNSFSAKKISSEKLNVILNNDFEKIKNMERYSYVGYLLNKIILKGNFIIIYKNNSNEKLIESIKLELNNKNNKNINIDTIQSFIEKMPDFTLYDDNNGNNNILEIQKKLGVDNILKIYFTELKNIIKEEKIMNRFTEVEFSLIIYELENYILSQLYEKIFPVNETKEDTHFYNKSIRLNFIKPDNVIKDKTMINEKLLEYAMDYIKDINIKKTPIDKLSNFGKAIDIIKNSITFNSSKTDLGLDDTLSFIIYIILKSQFKNIYTNLNYCKIYMNQELEKKVYGSLLTQLNMVVNIIKDMKYNDLINITKEQFGND